MSFYNKAKHSMIDSRYTEQLKPVGAIRFANTDVSIHVATVLTKSETGGVHISDEGNNRLRIRDEEHAKHLIGALEQSIKLGFYK